MTIFTECSDITEDSIQERKMTPYDVLNQCNEILQERGKQRDANGNILESSFSAAANLYNQLFASPTSVITARDVIEILVSLKLARIQMSHCNLQKDTDSLLDLINYLSFLYAENHNYY